MKLALISHVNEKDGGPSVDDLMAYVKALHGQLVELSKHWNIAAPESVFVATKDSKLDPGTREIGIWQTPVALEAENYVASNGQPSLKVYLGMTSGLRGTERAPTTTPRALSLSLSQLLSRAACNLWASSGMQRYTLRDDGHTLDAFDVVSAVEDVTYLDPEGTGCLLSNYLMPAAFSPNMKGSFDRQGGLRSRYDLTPGGSRTTFVPEVNDKGEIRLSCVVQYGPEHVTAHVTAHAMGAAAYAAKGGSNFEPLSQKILLQKKCKEDSIRAEYALPSFTWRPAFGETLPPAVPLELLVRAKEVQVEAARGPAVIPPPPPAPYLPQPNRSAARTAPILSAATARAIGSISGHGSNSLGNPARHAVPVHSFSATQRVRSMPVPHRPTRFHQTVMQAAHQAILPEFNPEAYAAQMAEEARKMREAQAARDAELSGTNPTAPTSAAASPSPPPPPPPPSPPEAEAQP
jgi:hypothetical protein